MNIRNASKQRIEYQLQLGLYRVGKDPTEVGTLKTVGETGTIRLDSRSVNAAGLNAKDT